MENQIRLPRSTPEDQGIASGSITDFLDAIKEQNLELHSFMLLRHGQVVAEGWWAPYQPEYRHLLFSLSKSFTSTAVGFAVSENLLSLDDKVVSFFPEDLPVEVSSNLSEMRVRHLLMMGTGNAEDTTARLWQQEDGNWARAFLSAPVEHPPGTQFVYNSGATYMLSAILNKVTGQSLLDYLDNRLFAPLGIAGATWETCPRGIAVGGWGMSITTEHIAKFGQLYLQRGVWNGKQLLPSGWVEEATSKHISNGSGGESDWAQGYGYQFWRCRHGAYRGDGAFGQFCIVLPEQDAVIAVTAGTNDMQGILNVVWQRLLPAMETAALPANVREHTALVSRLQHLRLDAPQTDLASPNEERLEGHIYHLDPNQDNLQTISFKFIQYEATATVRNAFGEQTIHLGRGEWKGSRLRVYHGAEQQVEGSFTWRDLDILEITLRYVETPFAQTVTCQLAGEDILLEIIPNVSFLPYESSPIRGKIEEIDY